MEVGLLYVPSGGVALGFEKKIRKTGKHKFHLRHLTNGTVSPVLILTSRARPLCASLCLGSCLAEDWRVTVFSSTTKWCQVLYTGSASSLLKLVGSTTLYETCATLPVGSCKFYSSNRLACSRLVVCRRIIALEGSNDQCLFLNTNMMFHMIRLTNWTGIEIRTNQLQMHNHIFVDGLGDPFGVGKAFGTLLSLRSNFDGLQFQLKSSGRKCHRKSQSVRATRLYNLSVSVLCPFWLDHWDSYQSWDHSSFLLAVAFLSSCRIRKMVVRLWRVT